MKMLQARFYQTHFRCIHFITDSKEKKDTIISDGHQQHKPGTEPSNEQLSHLVLNSGFSELDL